MSDSLTLALQPVVTSLVDDMRQRLHDDEQRLSTWKAEHTVAAKANRTAGSFSEWEEEQLQQAAVGWVLTTVFIRFIEDNGLFGEHWAMISGRTNALRSLARENEQEFYAKNPEQSYRGYLEHCFEMLDKVPATKGLVDDHAAFRILEPSDRGARKIIDFWRAVDDEGQLTWPLHDDELSTRFLGDMYQDLSAYARERYALLQTPVFVEEFILERTLLPALEERPLEGFKLIDPTCGSGHFLLGAYEILLDRWQRYAPAMEPRDRANEAMKAIHGVDINPAAVAITQFRLTVAFMKAAEEPKLDGQLSVPEFTMLAGDTLYWGPGSSGADSLPMQYSQHGWQTEDLELLSDVLAPGQYDVVVGNPPYITVQDTALRSFYRARFSPYCKGKYALTVPSMVVFFHLARESDVTTSAGWVGQITSNSFMKRSFGKPLIEEFFGTVDLREVIDSAGAYVPGHGTPTAILIGRNASPSRRKVLGVLGIQGEPGIPNDASRGLVWQSITQNITNTGFENEYISVTELSRDFIESFPWNLQGGAAPAASKAIDSATTSHLGSHVYRIGVFAVLGSDDAMFYPREGFTPKIHHDHFRTIALGEEIRDFSISAKFLAWYPYDSGKSLRNIDYKNPPVQDLWCSRRKLQERATFGGGTYLSDGRPWFEWHQMPTDKGAAELTITFAFVATHNHFVLDRGGKVFNRSAPVIKLGDDATEDDHLALLGILNSSTACFWLKQNSHNKGSTVDTKGARTTLTQWENFYEAYS